ncbi:MFS transporter [Paenibacillus sp. J2TS4]|uniref:MFS transporter n=1 Tax=Paenibacillus sp. J2TS4 TaxID=2807194 RepID=UPI001B0AF483|nr:MFS transporter [Paenibacillus sp. J2TS4]GIP32863.1 tetracycline resistance MFS efflux pump [Paenibacillus sp. J2TS4]
MKKQMIIIMLLLMTVFIGFGIIIPILPVIIGGGEGEGIHLALLLSLYSAVSFIMSPWWGGVSDRIGRRPVLLTGLLGFSLSFFLFAIAGDNLWLMYVSRIIGGAFSGAVTSCAVAYVADITSEEERTKGMGLVGMSIGLGFLFGPALGGILSVWGNSAPFFASSLLSLLTFIFAFRFLTESLPESARKQRTEEKPSRWTAFQGSLKYLYVLSFFVTFTLAGLETTFQLFQMLKIGIGPYEAGMMFFVSGLVGALIQGGVVRRHIKPGMEKNAIRLGLILSAIGFVLILFSTNVITAAIYLSIFGAGNALIRPCVISLITQKTNVGQGIATGLNSSMDSLGRIAGPLVAMGLYGLEVSLPYIVGAILCVAALTLVARFVKLDKRQGKVSKAAL